MNTPENLAYAESHEWIRIEGEEAVIGITEYAQHALGDITYVSLPLVGNVFAKGQEMAVIESVKAASDIYMPTPCKVIAVNEKLDTNPELINQDPYGDGWIIRVNCIDGLEGLLTAQEYAAKYTD